MKYFNLLDWVMKYQKKFRGTGRVLWESGNTVETVCLLGKRKPDGKVRIDVDLEDYYRIKDAKKN